MIPEKLYTEIIKVLPIVCVDIVIQNKDGEYLLVKRKNEPLKDEWWVVGGRINHCEGASDAVIRKLKEEIGLIADINKIQPIGYYEDRFDNNSFDIHCNYHTLSLVFKIKIHAVNEIKLDSQSSDWKWNSKLPERFNIHNYQK